MAEVQETSWYDGSAGSIGGAGGVGGAGGQGGGGAGGPSICELIIGLEHSHTARPRPLRHRRYQRSPGTGSAAAQEHADRTYERLTQGDQSGGHGPPGDGQDEATLVLRLVSRHLRDKGQEAKRITKGVRAGSNLGQKYDSVSDSVDRTEQDPGRATFYPSHSRPAFGDLLATSERW